MISFTEVSGVGRSVVFRHPPYIRGLQPARDIQVSVEDPVVIAWEAIDVDNGGSAGTVPAAGLAASDGAASSPNIRIILTTADFGAVTTWASITSPTQVHRMWLANSTDGSLGSEIELNEGVDTSFVIVGNRLRNNLGAGSCSSGSLKLQTNSGFGQTYYVYLAIDGDNGDGVVGDQPANFAGISPS